MLENFPYHVIPDGNVFAPHHIYHGLILMWLAVMGVWDNQKTDPMWTMGSLCVMLMSFTFVWPTYTVLGALMSVLSLPFSLLAYLRAYKKLNVGKRLAVMYLIGWLVAADDILEHAFGWATPLDRLFKWFILPAIQSLGLG